MTASEQTYEAIIDEVTWYRVQSLLSANARSNVVASARGIERSGVRRADSSRYPLAGLVTCDCCGRKLQGNIVRGNAMYRCTVRSDYPVSVNDHPPSLSVRDDRLLPHVDNWLFQLFAPECTAATARSVVDADAAGHPEDPALGRARSALIDCDRKLSKHLDGLEAGIPAEVSLHPGWRAPKGREKLPRRCSRLRGRHLQS